MLFLNPGKSTENFWSNVDAFAAASATRLGIELQTFHANRNQYSMIKYLQRVIEQQQLPDYLLLVNEKQALPRMLRLLEGQSVYVVIVLNDLDPPDKVKVAQQAHWQKYLISRLLPDNYWVGEQTARAIYQQAGEQPGVVLMISGDSSTPASREREAGALSFFKQQLNLEVKQPIYGHWSEQQSYQKTKALLQRYPQIKYIWTANDHMAFGSIRALEEAKKQPGKDVYVSSINTSKDALKLREQGQISALGGGHFMAAGWALRLIQLHHQGYSIPNSIELPMFRLLQPNTPLYQQLKLKDWSSLPFDKLFVDEQNQFTLELLY